ncbi:MAG TPA: DUF493 domain-containing protein [Burkholderiaceae bacterium]|nr:DUF493 domain-containing protein [Burkholderiaceae bacterium]
MSNPDGPDGAQRQPSAGGALVFPTDFPIKILGPNRLEFEPQMIAIVRNHAPDVDLSSVEVRQSRAGNYLSITVTIRAQSREQLDAIYLDLTRHPWVKVVL